MIEFTPGPEDRVNLGHDHDRARGELARDRSYYVLVGLLIAVLIGIALGSVVQTMLMTARPRVAIAGGIPAAAIWLIMVVVWPAPRQRWADQRSRHRALRAIRPTGPIRVWADAEGLNWVEGGVHTHLRPDACQQVMGSEHYVSVSTGMLTTPELDLPRRVGMTEIASTMAAVGLVTGVSRESAMDGPSDRPSPGAGPVLQCELTADDVEAMHADFWLLHPRPMDVVREEIRLRKVRAVARGLLLASAIVGLCLVFLLLFGAFAVWVAAMAAVPIVAGVLTSLPSRAEPGIRVGGGERRESGTPVLIWVDDEGVGCSDRLISRHVAFAVASLVETSDHFFVHTTSWCDSIAIPRELDGTTRLADAIREGIHDAPLPATLGALPAQQPRPSS